MNNKKGAARDASPLSFSKGKIRENFARWGMGWGTQGIASRKQALKVASIKRKATKP